MVKVEPQNLEALDAPEPYDVCVVGSGFVGTAIAQRLSAAGRRVLILESGGRLRNWMFGKELKELAAYESEGNTDYPTDRTTARAIGGNSNFWTGRAERFQPIDFTGGPYTDPACPWPMDYEELKPYYLEAEKFLNVGAGPFSEHMPPRDHPMPAQPVNDISALRELFASQGIVIDDSPTSRPKRGLRFYRLGKEALPTLLARPEVSLVSGVTVTRLEHDDQQRITHAVCRLPDGQTRNAHAKVFVLGCGGIQTPRLMLLSTSQRFPDGLGNDSGWVGRGFNEHAAVNIYAKIKHNRHTLWPRHKIGRTQQFYDHYFDQGLGAIHPVFIQSYVFPHHLVHYTAKDMPKHLLKVIGRSVKATIYTGCQIEMVPDPDNRITLSESQTDMFGDPLPKLAFNYHDKDRELLDKVRDLMNGWLDGLGATNRQVIPTTWARHHIGTTRMGDDPNVSVCNRDGRVHAVQNLFLCGCETFPTGGGLPPSLTACALSLRLGAYLDRWLKTGASDAVEIPAALADEPEPRVQPLTDANSA